LRELKMGLKIAASADGAFISGRGADLVSCGRLAGCFGEIHPAVITGFGLEQPVVALEVEIPDLQ